MSTPDITSPAFLTPGGLADADPCPGLEETLRLFEYRERNGGTKRQPPGAPATPAPRTARRPSRQRPDVACSSCSAARAAASLPRPVMPRRG